MPSGSSFIFAVQRPFLIVYRAAHFLFWEASFPKQYGSSYRVKHYQGVALKIYE
jgi:hypothetical protein